MLFDGKCSKDAAGADPKGVPERPTRSEQFHNNTSVSAAKMLVRGSAWASPERKRNVEEKERRAAAVKSCQRDLQWPDHGRVLYEEVWPR